MENIKSFLFTIFGLGILFLIGYWAFTSIQSGSDHVNIQELKELKNENEELNEEISKLRSEISLLESQKEQQIKDLEQEKQEQIQVETPKPTTPVINTYKYQDLITNLQKIIDQNIFLKRKSQGIYVGTVQKFLNVYNNTSTRIDNDFGASTETAVKSFQKNQGLTADGEVGVTTLRKMIEWLKKR